MNVTKINCEWDIGCNECLWETEEKAREHVAEALTDCGIEEPMDELEGAGLLSFETVKVIA